MRILGKFVLCAFAVALAGCWPQLFATEAIANEQGKMKCTACHDKAGSKRLTDQGKYYEIMDTVEGYQDLKGTFRRCTYCHVNKPGSEKLTKRGKQLTAAIAGMDELREWLAGEHPDLAAMLEKTAQNEDPDSAED